MIADLIRAHIDAHAEHQRVFRLNDWEMASDEEVAAKIDQIDEALLALCRARPTDAEQRTLQREYLLACLPHETDSCPDLIKAAFKALLS